MWLFSVQERRKKLLKKTNSWGCRGVDPSLSSLFNLCFLEVDPQCNEKSSMFNNEWKPVVCKCSITSCLVKLYILLLSLSPKSAIGIIRNTLNMFEFVSV